MNTNAPIDTIMRHGRFYLRHHSRKRLTNLALTLQSLVRRPLHAPNMPISLKIEPSAMCHLACPGCVQANPLFKIQSRGKAMTMGVFKRILDEAGDYLYRIQFYDNGEPFFNRQLLEMISLAASLDIGSQVSTNFSFPFPDDFYRQIVESGLEHLIIAMDGLSSATYSQYRINGRYDLVERGLRQVVHWKRRLGLRYPLIEWQFIVFEHNKHEIARAKEMARAIGVDRLCLKYDARAGCETWRSDDRLKDKLIRRFRLHSCLWLWGSLLIDYDGTVRPCCNASRNEMIGDLTTTPLSAIWNSKHMMQLRECVRRDNNDGDSSPRMSCHGCPQII